MSLRGTKPTAKRAPQTAAQHEAARAARRTAALETVARTGGPEAKEAKRILVEQEAGAKKVAAAKAPRTIAEAGGDARAFARADMQRAAAEAEGKTAGVLGSGTADMRKQLRAQGIEPAR